MISTETIGLSNPFNYTGSKYRYLKDLFEVLHDKKHLRVCDMFFGGGDLSMHLPVDWRITGYEVNKHLLDMHKEMGGEITTQNILGLCSKAKLSKKGKGCVANYNNFKAVYNWEPCPAKLYTLICHSNTNRLRFGPNGYNVSFGDRTFNINMQKKLDNYLDRLSVRDIVFEEKSSLGIDLSYYDLLLVDPPYLNSVACYNEKGGWGVVEELKLQEQLLSANERGQKFVYFNQSFTNGKENKYFTEFIKQFNTKVLKTTTESCSNNRKKKGVTTEIMCWN